MIVFCKQHSPRGPFIPQITESDLAEGSVLLGEAVKATEDLFRQPFCKLCGVGICEWS